MCEFGNFVITLIDRREKGMCEFLSDSYCLTEDGKVCMSFYVTVIV